MTLNTPVLPRVNALYTTLCAVLVFICLASVSFAQGYSVKAKDTLRIEVLEDPSLNRTVLVDPAGRISFPSAGTIRVSGLTVENIEGLIAQRIAGGFASTPNVFVSLSGLAEDTNNDSELEAARIRANALVTSARIRASEGAVAGNDNLSVFVMGEANNPGQREIEPGTTVLQMFAVMGGFTKFAATKRVQLRRTDPNTGVEQITNLNYRDIERGDASGSTILMQEGDVIVVPQRRLFE